jgi:hypothetical protein
MRRSRRFRGDEGTSWVEGEIFEQKFAKFAKEEIFTWMHRIDRMGKNKEC